MSLHAVDNRINRINHINRINRINHARPPAAAAPFGLRRLPPAPPPRREQPSTVRAPRDIAGGQPSRSISGYDVREKMRRAQALLFRLQRWRSPTGDARRRTKFSPSGGLKIPLPGAGIPVTHWGVVGGSFFQLFFREAPIHGLCPWPHPRMHNSSRSGCRWPGLTSLP